MTRMGTQAAALLCLPCLLWAQDEPAAIRVGVSLVTVACAVTDHDGAFVPGLKVSDFRLSDNGAEREIKYLWHEEDLPLTVGLVVDVSWSQMRAIEQHRTAVEQFFKQVLGPRDRAFLVTVGAEVKIVTDLTGSLSELERGVRNIDAQQSAGQQLGEPCVRPKGSRPKAAGCGGTALWNAVYSAAKWKLADVAGRKALIVLSDGMDLGSSHSLPEAIAVAQSADTLVYTIHSAGMPIVMPFFKLRGKQQLNRLAGETGAKAFSDPKEKAAEVYAQIEKELRSVYVLGFAPPEGNKSAGRHKLEVKVARKGVTVRSRKEYSIPAVEGETRTR